MVAPVAREAGRAKAIVRVEPLTDVEERPKEMVRLWPKFAVAAAPEYVIEVRPTAPMALVASSMVDFASCARAIAGRRVQTNAVTRDVFRIRGHAPAKRDLRQERLP